MKSVCIIIVNFEWFIDTMRVIDDLERIETYSNKEIVVIDNGSENDSKFNLFSALRKKKGITFFSLERNLGLSNALNIGISYALKNDFDYILTLSSDLYFDKPFIKNLLDELNDETICSTPNIINDDKTLVLLDIKRFSKNNLRKKYKEDLEKEMQEIIHRGSNVFVYRPHISCMMLDASFFKNSSLFDQNVFLFYEALILGERIFRENKKVLFIPSITLIHKDRNQIFLSMMDSVKSEIMENSLSIYLRYRYGRMSGLISMFDKNLR